MKNRNPVAVILLTLVTFGIYGLYWMVKTKGELNARGASIPTAWLLIVPLVNIWWLWKYSEGVALVTHEKLSAVLAFILLFVLDLIGMGIVQHYFNQEAAPATATAPAAAATASDVTPDQAPEAPVAPAPPVAPAEPTTPPTDQNVPPTPPTPPTPQV